MFKFSCHGTSYYLLGVPAESCLGGYLALEFQSVMCLEKSPFPLENPLSLHDVHAVLFCKFFSAKSIHIPGIYKPIEASPGFVERNRETKLVLSKWT